jgi:hypothetical protein
MIFLPALGYIFSSVTSIAYLDEVVLTFMLGIVLVKLIPRLKVSVLMLVVLGFVFYNLALIAIWQLPASHVVQIVITLKFMVYYYYFYSLPDWYKPILLRSILRLLIFAVILTMCLAVFELFLIPELYSSIFNIYRDGRGIDGVFLTSFFHSRSLFAQFILFILIVVLSMKSNAPLKGLLISNRTALITILIVMLLLSTSRKEFALAMIILCALIYLKLPIRSVFVRAVGVTLALLLGGALFYLLFSEINTQTIGNEDYIRFNIWRYGIEIFNYYFPFGSGPGTYGSLMSRDYMGVYNQFDVSQDILGWDGELAPIYDVYLASVIAEYGLFGLIFYTWLLFLIKKQLPHPLIGNNFYVSRSAAMCIGSLLFLALFAPVFVNLFGFLVFLFLGISHARRNAGGDGNDSN